jgi:hypothetical protein
VGFDDAVRASRLSWLAVSIGTAVCALLAVIGADARWLAALGRTIAHAGTIPDGVPYAAAQSHGWANVPVLAELVFHAVERAGGDRALIVAQILAVAAALLLIAVDMRKAGAPDGARAVVLVAIPFATVASLVIVRSQLFSLALFPLCALLLRSESRNPSRRIWLLVPLVALWSNLHGAVLVGVAVAGAYLVFDRARHDLRAALSVLAASLAALFATPALGRTGSYYLGVLHSEVAVKGEGMWAPLSLQNLLDVLFVVVALPLLVLALRSRPKLWELVALCALAASAVHVGRNSVWFIFFVATPAAFGLSGGRLKRLLPSPGVVRACALAPLALLLFVVLRTPPQSGAGDELRAEAGRVAAGSPILADDVDAEKLALDGRRVVIANPIDAFNLRDQQLYLSWLDGRPAGDVLLRDVRAVVVPVGSRAERRLARDRGFRRVAQDAAAVLYARAG